MKKSGEREERFFYNYAINIRQQIRITETHIRCSKQRLTRMKWRSKIT